MAFLTRWASGCMWSRPQAESVASLFAGDKRGETPRGESARRFCQEATVVQTRGRAGFLGRMGTWCIWSRPQAGSLATETRFCNMAS